MTINNLESLINTINKNNIKFTYKNSVITCDEYFLEFDENSYLIYKELNNGKIKRLLDTFSEEIACEIFYGLVSKGDTND